MPLRSLLSALVLLTALTAQRTWIVDVASGAGFDFTDLQPAIDAAANGDRIAVRPGSYGAFVIAGKGLGILGEPGAVVDRGRQIDIRDVPAGRAVSLRGLRISLSTSVSPSFWIRDNAGSVLLQDADLSGKAFLRVSNTALFSVNATRSTSSISTWRSGLQLVDCQFGFTLCLQESIAALVTTTATGSDASMCCQGLVLNANPGLELRGGTTRIAGNTVFRTGSMIPGAIPNPAISLRNGATVVVDPTVTLIPNPGSPAIVGDGTSSVDTVPGVSARAPAPGATLTGTVFAPSGSTAWVLAGLPTAPVPTPLGSVWLGTFLATVDSGPVGAGGSRPFQLPIPTTAPIGAALSFQSAVLDPAGLWLSTPATAVLGR